MTTKIYLAVNGTINAKPDDNLLTILKGIEKGTMKRKFSKRLGRKVTGGPTVSWVKSPSGIYMVDTGDYSDRGTLENSLSTIGKEENVDAVNSVKSIYMSHNDLDHNSNNDLFKSSYWMVDTKDELVELMLGPNETDIYHNYRAGFSDHRKRGITSDRFTSYKSNNHAGKPSGLKIYDAPGHQKSNKFFSITDDEVIIVNLETSEEFRTNRVLFTGDSICNENYLKRFLNQDHQIKKTAIYGNRVPTKQYWAANNQEERDYQNRQTLKSIGKIVTEAKKGGMMIFSHGGVYNYQNKTSQKRPI